jgi:hypothetical protein
MRVLFSAETPLSMTSFQSVVHLLAERGHEVLVAFHEERDREWRDDLVTELVSDPTVSVERRWAGSGPLARLSSDLRSSLDLLQFLDPHTTSVPGSGLGAGAATAQPSAARRWGVTRRRSPRADLRHPPADGGDERRDRGRICANRSRRRPVRPTSGLRQIQPDFLRAAQALAADGDLRESTGQPEQQSR